jgi:hypothetical protein
MFAVSWCASSLTVCGCLSLIGPGQYDLESGYDGPAARITGRPVDRTTSDTPAANAYNLDRNDDKKKGFTMAGRIAVPDSSDSPGVCVCVCE